MKFKIKSTTRIEVVLAVLDCVYGPLPLFLLTTTITYTVVAPAVPSASIPDVTNFFPEVNGDLTKVTWSHGVNSQETLKGAIAGPSMMLEADIIMGAGQGSTSSVPLMGHPPDTTSDLTFESFLESVVKANTELQKHKGIKLDFKVMDAVQPVLLILEREAAANRITFPVWLNADVVHGPIDAEKEAINGSIFITQVSAHLPAATLSLGWTTRYEPKQQEEQGYTEANLQEMEQLVLQKTAWKGAVTFPVRAMFLKSKKSMDDFTKLLGKTGSKSTLTLWSLADDPVDKTALKDWVCAIGRNRVFVDLPFDLDLHFDVPPARPKTECACHPNYSSDTPTWTYVFVTMAVLIVMFAIAYNLYRAIKDED